MPDETYAGDEARTGGDAPTDQKPDAVVLSDGGVATARVPELPDFQRDILLTLARSGPTHGQGLVDDLSALRDEEINHGRLYPNLDKLAGKGLIEKDIRAPDGRTNEYKLTAAGRAALQSYAQRIDEAISSLDGGDR